MTVPPMPKGTTLEELITAKHGIGSDGRYHLGAVSLSPKEYQQFQRGQRALGGTPHQLETLWSVRHGVVREMAPFSPPQHVTMNALLQHSAPDAHGLVHFGHLAVQHGDLQNFLAAERLLAHDPEAVAVLHRLESGPQHYRLSVNGSANDSYAYPASVIAWDPSKMVRDQYDKAVIPPYVLLLHEQTHAVNDPDTRYTLTWIPDGNYSNYEEMRVIRGVELRCMRRNNLKARESHLGASYETTALDSVTPILHVEENGVERVVRDRFSVTGTVATVDPRYVTIQAGDQMIRLRTNELVGFMGNARVAGGETNTEAVLHEASARMDTVTFTIGDGKIQYENPRQLRDWLATPAQQRYFQLLATPEAVQLELKR